MAIRTITYDEIRKLVRLEDTIEPVRESFKSYSQGAANIPPVQHLEMPDRKKGALHIKTGHVEPLDFCVVKVASTFPENTRRVPPSPSINGVIVLFSALDGEPLAVLEDRALITQLRTAAAGAVAAEALARKGAETLAVFGSGTQARLQTEAILHVLPGIRRVVLWGRTPAKAQGLAEDLGAGHPGVAFEARASAEEAAREADILVTTTYAAEPILRGEWVREGALVIGMGADSIHKRELDESTILSADKVFVDSRTQNEILAEVGHGIREGLWDASRIDGELGEVLAGSRPGRMSDRERIVCKLTGVAVQEIFVCDHLLRTVGITAGDPAVTAAVTAAV